MSSKLSPSHIIKTKTAKGKGKYEKIYKKISFFIGSSITIFVLAFVIYLLIEPYSEYTTLSSLNSYFRVKGFRGIGTHVDVVFERTGLMGGVNLNNATIIAKTRFPAKSTLFEVPRNEIIDHSVVFHSLTGQLVLYNNGSHLNKIFKENSYILVFLFSFYLLYEKRLGHKSSFASFFSGIPDDFSPSGGAIYFPEEIDNCLDIFGQKEFQAFREPPPLFLEAAKACCELSISGDNPVCQLHAKNPFTLDEFKWAFTLYIRSVFNEQVVIPGLNFMRRSSKTEGVGLRKGKTDGIEIYSQSPLKAGEELFFYSIPNHYYNLAVFGTFEQDFEEIAVPIRIPTQEKPNSIAYKSCFNQRNKLVWRKDGEINIQLLQCIGSLMLDKKNRKKIIQDLNKNQLLQMYLYSNLTLLASRQYTSLANTTLCNLSVFSEELKLLISNYRQKTLIILTKNIENLFNKVNSIAKNLNVQSPLEMKDDNKTEDINVNKNSEDNNSDDHNKENKVV